jgi:hypothetical protein
MFVGFHALNGRGKAEYGDVWLWRLCTKSGLKVEAFNGASGGGYQIILSDFDLERDSEFNTGLCCRKRD